MTDTLLNVVCMVCRLDSDEICYCYSRVRQVGETAPFFYAEEGGVETPAVWCTGCEDWVHRDHVSGRHPAVFEPGKNYKKFDNEYIYHCVGVDTRGTAYGYGWYHLTPHKTFAWVDSVRWTYLTIEDDS